MREEFIKEIFNNELLHPVVADIVLLKLFGPAYWFWEPETLWREIQLTVKASPPLPNRDCIQAVRFIHQSNRHWEDWYTFEKIVAGLNNEPVLFQVGQVPTIGQIMAALDSISLIRKPDKIHEDIIAYISAVLIEESIYPIPPELSVCEPYITAKIPNRNILDDMKYRKYRQDLMKRQLLLIME